MCKKLFRGNWLGVTYDKKLYFRKIELKKSTDVVILTYAIYDKMFKYFKWKIS